MIIQKKKNRIQNESKQRLFHTMYRDGCLFFKMCLLWHKYFDETLPSGCVRLGKPAHAIVFVLFCYFVMIIHTSM